MIAVKKEGPITIKADYWILDVDEENYTWAIVGLPNRTGLWFLSRNNTLDAQFIQGKSKVFEQLGFKVEKLKAIDHAETCKY